MSGGSFNYMYIKVEETYSEMMEDEDLNNMIKDLVLLLHDLEWWKSNDYDEKSYRESVRKFKDKWFGKRDEQLRIHMLKFVDEFKERIEEL